MMAAGHCAPTMYALYMILGHALDRKYQQTKDKKYFADPKEAILPIDALGFRRGHGALINLLSDQGLQDDPLFAQAKLRGIKALSGHAESIDVTNDVNGGPSGVGVATAAGKAAFWDMAGAGIDAPKIIALEGEFAMTEGQAQELKTQALAMQVGKRMRIYLSDNNAGIDDALHGGVIPKAYADQYDLVAQWTSYGWNVFTSDDGGDYAKVVELLQAMENSDASDKRPVIAIAKTTKGYWPTAKDGKLGGAAHITGYKSHPNGYKMNSEYFVAMASTFEEKYGVKFAGIRDGAPKTEKERIVQFKTNIDVVMSGVEQKGLGDWVADRLVALGDSVKDNEKVQFAEGANPFLDERLKVANLPVEAQKVTATNRISGATKEVAISLFKQPGELLGARSAISEIIKYMNYVTDNRFVTLAADLSESINVEHGA